MDFILSNWGVVDTLILLVFTGLGVVWRLLAWRQKDYENRVDTRIEDHEIRVRTIERNHVTADDIRHIEEKMDTLEGTVRRSLERSCNHNRESEQRLHARFDSLVEIMMRQQSGHAND